MIDVNKPLPWWQIVTIQLGPAISAPLFISGMDLDKSLGNLSATLGVFLGNAFLLAVALVSGLAGTWKHKSLTQCAAEIFGITLNPLYVFIVGSVSVYWLAAHLNIMSSEIAKTFFTEQILFATPFIKIALILLIGGLVALGINSLYYLSLSSILLTIPFVSYVLYELYFSDLPITLPAEKNLAPLSFRGISIVIGLGIMAAIDMPTFMRQSRSTRDSILACLLLFAFMLPAVQMLGVTFYSFYGDFELKELLVILINKETSMHVIYVIFIVIGLATCLINLYLGVVNTTTLYPQLNIYKVLFSYCFITGLISLFDPLEALLPFNILSIVLTSMGSVIVFEFIYQQTSYHFMDIFEVNLIAWGTGIIVGIVSLNGWIIFSEIPAFDAFLASGLVKLIQFLTSRYVYVSYSEEV